MKNFIILFIAFILVFNVYAQSNFCDDFEDYQTGNPIAETSSNWNSWGELMSGTTAPFIDDANIVNTNASSGNNSLYFIGIGAGGPQDVIFPFGSATPYTIGNFEFSANFFVNSGTGAYFNFQAENIPGTTWSLDVQMDNIGNISFENGGGITQFITTTYPMGVWFEIKIIVDLTNNNWEIFIDGISKGNFNNTVNKIASLDFYPITGHEFYVDDVCYNYIPIPPSWNCNGQGGCIDPGTGFGQYDTLSNCELDCIFTTVEENNNKLNLIYPNPAKNKIYISNLKENNILIEIYDINGRLVIESKISNKEYVNISKLSKGIYQINFEGSNWKEIRKLIKN